MAHSDRHRAAVDTRYDEALRSTADQLHWLPWVGTGYTYLPRCQRLLIVGESHYHWTHHSETPVQVKSYLDNPEFTRYFVFDHGFKTPPKPTKFTTALTRALYGRQHSREQKQRLWSSVAYFNRVQRPMASARARPTQKDYQAAWDTFFAVISLLQPGHCLFAGVEICGYTEEMQAAARRHGYTIDGPERRPAIGKTTPRLATVTNAAGEATRLLFIRHPSSFFSWQKWGRFVDEHLPGYRQWLLSVGGEVPA
ncbi:hypothetical protein [Hymenobacter wooponensis]|uniref:Uncharacterized protein n=1 Tax=Hymenobacter wooponensis TaxID=1525360 RepID=A0A4Z0MR80_9BACT|nr:hypothetical protein [Hymenobacter wooponensis]TGD81727.1 hypothetical protein EU557_09330 [Hymenobacter wooponensis]